MPDGLRLQHISNLVNCIENGPQLVALNSFGPFSSVAQSWMPAPDCNWLLLAQTRIKNGKYDAVSRAAAYLSPRQVGKGMGTPGGREAAVHVARRFLY